MTKRSIIVLVAISVLLSAVISGSIAYFVSKATTDRDEQSDITDLKRDVIVGGYQECDFLGLRGLADGVTTFRGSACDQLKQELSSTSSASVALADSRLIITVRAADGSGTYTVVAPHTLKVSTGDPWPPERPLTLTAN